MKVARGLLVMAVTACTAPPPPPIAPAPAPMPQPRTTVSIARLDQVEGNFHTFDKDPLLREILAAGDAAVEPLIDALEHDDRASRAEFDTEHAFEKPEKVPVFRIAYWLLGRLIGTRYFEAPYTPEMVMAREGKAGRAKVAAEVRAEWAKWRGVPLVERWYRVMADGASAPDDFVDAAKKVLEFVEDLHYDDPSDVAKRAPLAGAALRGKTPDVAALIAGRIDRLEPSDACELARLVGRWDAAQGESLAAAQMRRAIAASGKTLAEAHCVRVLTTVRVALGDQAAALDEYAAWIGEVAPPVATPWDAGVFEPMWLHAEVPSIARAAEKLFGGATSAWLPIIPVTNDPSAVSPRIDLLGMPLWRVKAFQRHVIAALGDRRVVGKVETRADRGWGVAVNGAGSMSTTAEANDSTFPATPTSNVVRVADYYAWKIAAQDGAPRFELWWPLAQRDAVIATTAAWIKK